MAPKTETKGITLEKFVEEAGTQKKASDKIGCTEPTLNRWLKKHLKPTGMTLVVFKSLGIDTTPYEK